MEQPGGDRNREVNGTVGEVNGTAREVNGTARGDRNREVNGTARAVNGTARAVNGTAVNLILSHLQLSLLFTYHLSTKPGF